jgi:DNA-binding protein HU-beta
MATSRLTKTQLQSAIAEELQTDRKTSGAFLDVLAKIAYAETKKKGEFVIPGIGKLVKQKRKARIGFNPKTGQKIKIPAKTVVKLRVAKAAKDAVLNEKAAAPVTTKKPAAAVKKAAPVAAKKPAPRAAAKKK